jgi:putative GMP synthase (glutamine-hydrolyzing)
MDKDKIGMHSKKPFLLLQSRSEDEASDDEYQAFLKFGGLKPAELTRLRLDTGVRPQVALDDYAGVLMGGGAANFAYDDTQKSPEQREFEAYILPLIRRIVAADTPFLGACLGVGALVTALGGRTSFDYSEAVGAVDIRLTPEAKTDPLLAGMPAEFRGFVGHKEGVVEPPSRCVVLARSNTCVQMLRVGRNVYATQFHPELDADGLALRINIYKHAGYFAPSEAQTLIDIVRREHVTEPVKILQQFIKRYQ